jgi:hypothetical protein
LLTVSFFIGALSARVKKLGYETGPTAVPELMHGTDSL